MAPKEDKPPRRSWREAGMLEKLQTSPHETPENSQASSSDDESRQRPESSD